MHRKWKMTENVSFPVQIAVHVIAIDGLFPVLSTKKRNKDLIYSVSKSNKENVTMAKKLFCFAEH